MLYPDWSKSKIVASGNGSNYTITEDGFILAIASGQNGGYWILVNGVIVANAGYVEDVDSIFMSVKKGDTISIRRVSGSGAGSVRFFPNRR